MDRYYPPRYRTERQKQNAKLWADAAKVTLSDPDRHGSKTPAA